MSIPFRFRDRLRSFTHALRGLRGLIITEHNARLHLLASVLVVILAVCTSVSLTDWALLVIAMAMVWVAEVFNTVIEVLADAVTPDHNPLIKRAKDLAAGAVLLAAVAALLIGCLVFMPVFSAG